MEDEVPSNAVPNERPTDDDVQRELQAMGSIAGLLTPLSAATRIRVLQWAAERFGVSGRAAGGPGLDERSGPNRGAHAEPARAETAGSFESLAELFDAAQPITQEQKALVGAYWLQVQRGAATLTGFAINSDIRLLGHRVRIADAMVGLQERKPALVLQLRKSGKTKQARKTYKVTDAGIRAVQSAIASGGFGGE